MLFCAYDVNSLQPPAVWTPQRQAFLIFTLKHENEKLAWKNVLVLNGTKNGKQIDMRVVQQTLYFPPNLF